MMWTMLLFLEILSKFLYILERETSRTYLESSLLYLQ